MSDRTPIEELRAAATIVRQAAAKATPGPWRIRQGNTISSNIADRDGHMVIDGGGWTDGTKTVVYGAALNADAAWIALMSPALAEPLAAWLESEALSLRSFDRSWHGTFAARALAVARSINGSES